MGSALMSKRRLGKGDCSLFPTSLSRSLPLSLYLSVFQLKVRDTETQQSNPTAETTTSKIAGRATGRISGKKDLRQEDGLLLLKGHLRQYSRPRRR
jgi:hypothetical protein